MYTRRQTHSAASAAFLLCSWSISLGAVFRAWSRWEQGRGGAGGCICQGTSFRGPTVARLGFHVCLQKHRGREGDRGEDAALPLLFSCVPSVCMWACRAAACRHWAASHVHVSMFLPLQAIRHAEHTQNWQQIRSVSASFLHHFTQLTANSDVSRRTILWTMIRAKVLT